MKKKLTPAIIIPVVLMLTLVMLLIPAQAVMAAEIYVTAGDSIQTAINGASIGDTIHVSAGTYNENLVITKSIRLLGDGADVTTLNGGNTGFTINCVGLTQSAMLDGFTITGGQASGVYVIASNLTISNCVVSGNTATNGGGIFNISASPKITNCVVSGNSASVSGGGILNISASPTITNCIFYGNSSLSGGAIFNSTLSNPLILNCTIYGNSATNGGGIFNMNNSMPQITNCILWGNGEEINNVTNNVQTLPTVTFSDVQGGYIGTGNIDLDPQLVDPENGDFHLSRGSPCIDTGDNSNALMPEFDYEGDNRIIDGNRDGTAIADMGADEYVVPEYKVGGEVASANKSSLLWPAAMALGGIIVGWLLVRRRTKSI